LLTSLVYGLSTPVVVALITASVSAVVSILVAIFTQSASRETSTKIATLNASFQAAQAELNASLQAAQAERDARRDYEFEARKRLYADCEPLLFQAIELVEDARSRIATLARTARNGDIRVDGSGWLESSGYFYKSTAFMLLAPITSYKILQRRLTIMDLGLEPRLRTQYELLKLIFLSFTRDFELARHKPRLSYKPDKADPEEPDRHILLRERPEKYVRQGLYRGVVDMISEALITSADTTPASARGGSRCMSLGEFWSEFDNATSALGSRADDVAGLIRGFHPATRPVLWRVFAAQHRLYSVFLATQASGEGTPVLEPPSSTDLEDLRWQKSEGDATDQGVLTPVVVADAYVREVIEKVLTAR
jgi:hypothetical protein